MDRRRFIFQGLAASGACAAPLSLFAKSGLPHHVSVRTGLIKDQEFKRILKEAKAQGKGILLHPMTKIKLNESHVVEVSLLGSGATIELTSGQLVFVNKTSGTQLINGVNFKGSVLFRDSKDQIVSKNTFETLKGSSIEGVNLINLVVQGNTIISHTGHGVKLHNDIETKIKDNRIVIKGEGHFTWMKDTMKGELSGNIFKNESDFRSTLVVMNAGDINPQMILKNNQIV